MRISDTTRKSVLSVAATTVAAFGLAAAHAAAGDTYEWSANLVSFDADSKTAVFEARVEAYADIAFDTLNEGDRLTLVWSGRSWAAGVRDLAENPELESWTLSLPVEFVGAARDNQYVSFRVPVPGDYVDTIAAIEPGMRVTGVSPKAATDWSDGVISLRHYNDVPGHS